MARSTRAKPTPAPIVEVTQEIIDQSQPRNSGHCMIAEALKAAVPYAAYVSVDLATIRFTDLQAGKRYVYLTPRVGQLALLDFDQGKLPAPFKFKLRAAQVVRSGAGRRERQELQADQRNKSDTRHTGIKRGGMTPPKGPLPSGAGATRTGKRREFGLRAIIQ